ncbi:MAG: hypothetical protein WC655_11165 [Candidatus Hydrogenedentales bacterium]
MHNDNAASADKEVENTRIQLPNVSELVDAITQGFGKWRTVIHAVTELCESSDHCHMIV